MKVPNLLGGLIGGMVGFAAGLVFSWFVMVIPLQANLNARERALQDWDRQQRAEREAIESIKTISAEELRKWVATVDEQNQRFATLERLAHEQEMRLVGPSLELVVIAAVVVLGVVALLVFMLRDANAVAATTLDTIATLAPEQMIHVAIVARLPTPPTMPSLDVPPGTSHDQTP